MSTRTKELIYKWAPMLEGLSRDKDVKILAHILEETIIRCDNEYRKKQFHIPITRMIYDGYVQRGIDLIEDENVKYYEQFEWETYPCPKTTVMFKNINDFKPYQRIK